VIFPIDDTQTETRWTEFCQAADSHGIRSTISLPLISHDEGIGALNLYSQEVAAFADTDETLAMALASQAAVVLGNAQVYWDAHELTQHLREAMRSRATIEQAKGILMGGSRCGPDEAFQMLVRASQRENRKLRDLAADLVSRAQRDESV
jgi:GAF domain-containing protein